MKYGKIVCGNIRYTASDDYTEVESIGGWLDVRDADIKTVFPNLSTIGGWLYANGADTRKTFPKLTAIGGWLYAHGTDTKTAFPKLTAIGGGVDVHGADTQKAFPNLTAICGWLYVWSADTKTAFQNLKTIGGDLYANGADTKTAFQNLKTIGGDLYANGADTKTTFPELTTIGGWLDVRGADTQKAFPKLKHRDNRKARQTANKKLNSVLLESGYMLQDEILSQHLASRKLANGLIVHTGIIVGKTDKTYVIETPDGVYAHGDTVKQARDSLLYKLSENRDTTPYKAWTLDTSITKRQAIQSYMAITGACETGTRHFVETRFGGKVPSRTTVRKVIEITAGQYGNEVYKGFFSENNNNEGSQS